VSRPRPQPQHFPNADARRRRPPTRHGCTRFRPRRKAVPGSAARRLRGSLSIRVSTGGPRRFASNSPRPAPT
jgi:hypothetical protein